jgi:hypothetical protein
LTDKCECSYGYVISGGQCVDGNMECHLQFGYNSSYVNVAMVTFLILATNALVKMNIVRICMASMPNMIF